MLNRDTRAKILLLWDKGVSARRIARAHSLSRHTVWWVLKTGLAEREAQQRRTEVNDTEPRHVPRRTV
jgi:DNA invertase Pin-like site-specific DNA recombinase